MRQALYDCGLVRCLCVLESTPSTNDAVLQPKGQTSPGRVVFAETQTAGRGQRGNRWESTWRKGLWFSILLRPKIALIDSPQLTGWAAQGIQEMLASAWGLISEMKAPNDVLISGKKVAGVLVEMRAQERAPHLAVIGIGLNVNQSVADFSPGLRERTTSLAIEAGTLFDRTELAITLLRVLDRTYHWS